VPVLPCKLWIWIAAVAFLTGFWFLPARLCLFFCRYPDRLIVNSRFVFWFVPLELNLVNPVTKVFWALSRNRPWEGKAPADLPARRIRWQWVLRRIRKAGRIAARAWRGANRAFVKTGKRIALKELNIYTEIGLADPAHTALSAGLVWALWGMAYSRLPAFFDMGSTQSIIKVVPNFSGDNLLVVNCSCIFEFRMGHIIIVIYQLIRQGPEILTLLRRISS